MRIIIFVINLFFCFISPLGRFQKIFYKSAHPVQECSMPLLFTPSLYIPYISLSLSLSLSLISPSLSISLLLPFSLSLSFYLSLSLSPTLSFSLLLSPSLSLLSIILFGVSNGCFRPCFRPCFFSITSNVIHTWKFVQGIC